MSAELGTFPIDTTKTRLQVQGQVIDSSLKELKYRGMFHALFRISKEEGVRALYNGIKPALLRQATYGTLKIGFYHGTKRLFNKDPKNETLLTNVLAGVLAGALSSAICNPTDVLKVRLQAQTSSVATNQGMLLAFSDIYKMEGFKGLYRGVGPTAQRASIIAGVELPVYDFSKKHIIQSGFLKDNPTTHFIASLIAGLAGALTSNPIDVVKTRLMNQRCIANSPNEVIYKGTVDCFVRTTKTEGFMALYKGFVPTFTRLGPWNILFFMSYEQLRKFEHRMNKEVVLG